MDNTTKTKPEGHPLHKVCTENVENPKIVFTEEKGIALQWYGKCEHFNLTGKQFHFPLNADLQTFYGQPESFEVIMVGQIKDFPNKAAIESLAKDLGGKNATIVFYISPKIGTNGTPAAAVIPMTVLLADENCGVIEPQDFFDDSVRINAIQAYQKQSGSHN